MTDLDERINMLAEWIAQSKRLVVFTGAGISTESGVPDFRGPNGLWTRQEKGLPPTAIVLLKTSSSPADLESAPYGYVLKLNMGQDVYLATDSPPNSSDMQIVFSIGELRANRNNLIWVKYVGDFPPAEWTRFN